MNTRIGILYPSDGAHDRDLWDFCPPEASLHFTRLRFPRRPVTLQLVLDLVEDPDIQDATHRLTQIEPSVIAYACTCISFARGAGGDRPIIRRIEEAGVEKATTTSTALAAACHALDVSRVSIAAPYIPEITQRLADFLHAEDISCVNQKSLGLYGGIANVTTEEVVKLCEEVDRPSAEALIIANTNISTYRVIAELEQRLGKPVIGANQATVWHACALAGVHSNNATGRLWKCL